MKSIIYKNPVISAVIINMITLIIFIYAISEKAYEFTMLIIVIGIVNTQILRNGQNIDKTRRTMIFISFFLIVIIYVTYALYKLYAVYKLYPIN